MKSTLLMSVFTATLALVSTAHAHLHINITPVSSEQGAALAVTHYGDPNFQIVSQNGRLEMQLHGSIYTVTADTITGQQYESLAPGLAGMRRGGIANFTSDAAPDLNHPASRTEPVGYEILSVVGVDDPTLSPRVLWRLFIGSVGVLGLPAAFGGHATFAGDSAGSDALARSYLLPVGAHAHGSASVPDSGFYLFTDAPPGDYDVTIRAWDAAGYFAASEPVTFRLTVTPEPQTVSLIGAAMIALGLRRSRRNARVWGSSRRRSCLPRFMVRSLHEPPSGKERRTCLVTSRSATARCW